MDNEAKAIHRVFSRKVLLDLMQGKRSAVLDAVVRQYVGQVQGQSVGQVLYDIYALQGRQCRDEYYYMNTLLGTLADAKDGHGCVSALAQLHVGRSVADFVALGGGRGCVYEVKSDLDNLGRLSGQLSDYYRAFGYVQVVACQDEADKVRNVLSQLGKMGESVGILAMDGHGVLSQGHMAVEYCDRLEHDAIFKMLRKSEYESVLLRHQGRLPQAEQVFYFRTCLQQFRTIGVLEAQRLALDELGKRAEMSARQYAAIPAELRAAVYFSGLARRWPLLQKALSQPYVP